MMTPTAFHDLMIQFYRFYNSHSAQLLETLEDVQSHYSVYKIRQGKRGKLRTIEQPEPDLMALQRELIPILETIPLNKACMAKRGFGIQHNAQIHQDAKYVLKVDIANCYSSIQQSLVYRYIKNLEPKEVIQPTTYATSLHYLETILRNCFIPKNKEYASHHYCHLHVLPTGAPTSPILCNIALTPLDEKIQSLADKYSYVYTRYIDDLHLSTTGQKRDWELIQEVENIVEEMGLKINKRKSKWYTVNSNDNVIITGVRIKEGSQVPRKFYRMVRARLQNLAKDKQSIDAETRGCLAYIQAIQEDRFNSLMEYYNRRLEYEPA